MASEYADYIFYGGSIITMEEGKPSVEALAVKGTIISAVGKRDEVFALAGPSTELPGFIEPHSHAVMMAALKTVRKPKA